MKQTKPPEIKFTLIRNQPVKRSTQANQEWTKGTCPNCGYNEADVDSEGVLWCPACGYSKKGCYT